MTDAKQLLRDFEELTKDSPEPILFTQMLAEMEAILRRAYGDEYVDAVLRGDYDGDYGDDAS